jgi:hypothetical protein
MVWMFNNSMFNLHVYIYIYMCVCVWEREYEGHTFQMGYICSKCKWNNKTPLNMANGMNV